MDTIPVAADGISSPIPRSLPTASYNITLNLSSIFSFIPSGFFSRIIRKGGQGMLRASDLPSTSVSSLEEWVTTSETAADILASASNAMADAGTMDAASKPPVSTQPAFPGPWGFFTSGYMIGLFLMAFLLHRMQNVIIPSRSFRRRVARSRSSGMGLGSLRHLYLSLLPLNLSRTSTRLAVHLPSLYFLSKMLLLWFLLVLQTSDMFPTIDPDTAARRHIGWIETLGAWSREKEMADICWSTFCAICGAFSIEGLVRALDGIGGGFPLAGNMNPNTSPFNLVGYAFLLHIYSSPITHVHKPDGFPSRPDKHVIITITIPLLQLAIFHYLSVSKRLSSHRLLPTMLTSFLSLLHFHSTLFSHFFFPSARPSPSASSPPSPIPASGKPNGRSYHQYMATQASPNYPLLNYIPNIFESMLILTILFSVCLNALAQLLVRGRVERLFSGLGLSPGGGTEDDVFGIHLPYDEDFGVLLLRMGTASLEATGLRGWGNEVAPIAVPFPGQTHHSAMELPENEYGIVRMGRTGVGSVEPSYVSTTKSKKKRLRGFQNEVRKVDVGVSGETAGRRRGRLVWFRSLWQFLVTLWGVGRGAGRWAWAWARAGVKWRRERVDRGVGPQEDEHRVEEYEEEEEQLESMYERFLRGEDISDDDDDEGLDMFDEEEDEEDEEDDDEEDEAEVDEDTETAALIRDLVRSSADGGEVVLAHMLHGSRGTHTSPLTRRRWGALAGGHIREHSDDELSESEVYFRRRRQAEPVDVERENARHWCVICTSEAREIICWPCRCLAMCDGCREALATRSAPTKHRCPCCRQLVEGYSRVYIP